MLKAIGRFVEFAWQRAADVHLLMWLVPAVWWQWPIAGLAAAGTGAIGILHHTPPLLWTPAALVAAAATSMLVRFFQHYFGERPIDETSPVATPETSTPTPMSNAGLDIRAASNIRMETADVQYGPGTTGVRFIGVNNVRIDNLRIKGIPNRPGEPEKP